MMSGMFGINIGLERMKQKAFARVGAVFDSIAINITGFHPCAVAGALSGLLFCYEEPGPHRSMKTEGTLKFRPGLFAPHFTNRIFPTVMEYVSHSSFSNLHLLL